MPGLLARGPEPVKARRAIGAAAGAVSFPPRRRRGIHEAVRRHPPRPPRARGIGLLALGVGLLTECHPVAVRPDGVTAADVAVPRAPAESFDLLGIGVPGADGRIALRPTGVAVPRGATVTVGVTGPGIVQGTGFLVVGTGFVTRLVRFAVTEGGGREPMPAAVLSIDVPAAARPGLYSLAAFRDGRLALLSGGLEVR